MVSKLWGQGQEVAGGPPICAARLRRDFGGVKVKVSSGREIKKLGNWKTEKCRIKVGKIIDSKIMRNRGKK